MNKEKRPFVPKTAVDFQKLKLDRLMANPDKPVVIPDTPRDRKGFTVPEFVRNVMGSSAGAGSGEFHVYRHLRRKEYTRQKVIDEKAEEEKLDEEFEKKIGANKRKMEQKTARNRAKRLKRRKRKEMAKVLKTSKDAKTAKQPSSESESSEEESSGEHSDPEMTEEQAEALNSNQDQLDKETSNADVTGDSEQL